MTDNSVVTLETCCPHCQHRLNRASHVSMTLAVEPKAGDVSLCIACSSLLIYADDRGSVRAATPEDVRRLMNSPEGWAEIEKAQMAIRAIHRQSEAS